MFEVKKNVIDNMEKVAEETKQEKEKDNGTDFDGCWGCEGTCKTHCLTTCKSWNRT